MIGYTKNWVASPNFTPGNQTAAFYGRIREILGGAGHWWNWPRSGASHDGIVSYMANRARQAAPHAVLSDRRVTEMVRDWDTAWCTGAANPYTFAIEIDPRIMFKWGYDNPSAAERQLGERIFETLCEYIADKKYHGIPWKAHKVWAPGTECNPIPYNEVMARAKQIYKEKYEKPAWNWIPMDIPRTMTANVDLRPLDLATGKRVGDVIKKGTKIEFRTKTDFNGALYLRTKYSTEHGLNYGIEFNNLKELEAEYVANDLPMDNPRIMVMAKDATKIDFATMKPVEGTLVKGREVPFARKTVVGGVTYLRTEHDSRNKIWYGIKLDDLIEYQPEWIKNLDDIEDLKLFVTPAEGTPVYDLNTGKLIPDSVIAKGTAVDIAMRTKVGDQEYYISNYAAKNARPNGIKIEDLAVPAEPPKNEKPAWLENLDDIEDVIMYTRANVPIVNLLTGETVGTILMNTPVDVAKATRVGEEDYFITKWAADEEKPHGILVAHLDKDPIKQPETPIEPDPVQPTLEERVKVNEEKIKAIEEALKSHDII